MHYSTFPNFYTSIPLDPPADEWQPLLSYLAKGLVRFTSLLFSINLTIGILSITNYYELHFADIIGATLIFWCVIFLLAELMGLKEVQDEDGLLLHTAFHT